MGFCKTICEIITFGIPILLAIALFPIAKDLITHSEFRAVTIRPQFDATPGQEFYLLDVTAERAVGIPSGLFSAPNPFANFFLKDDSLHSYATFPVFSTVNPVFIPEWTATFVVAPATDAGKALVDKAVLTAEIYANEFKPKLLGTAELSLKGLVNKEGETIDTWQELKDDKGKNAGRFNFRYVLRKGEQPPARTDPFYIHVIFFDYDADGIIDSKGTEAACKQLGFSDSIAWFLGAAIPPVLPSNLVSRLTHGVRHDDSNSWHHSDGKWDEISFNAYFAEADLNQDGYLSTYETLSSSWRVTRHDVPQFLGSLAELVLAHAVMADKQGLMSKDQLRGFLDGSLYTKLINERKH